VFTAPFPNELGGYGGQLAGVRLGVHCLGVGCRGRGRVRVGLGILQAFLGTGGLLLSCRLL
jgi:hypothetical protein